MAYDEALARRVRELLAQRHGITERRMFGGLAFLQHGKMFVGIRDDTLMARVGPARHADALAMSHVRPMDFTGRPIRGYVYIDAPGLVDDHALQAWVLWCADFVAALTAPAARPAAGGPPHRRRQRRWTGCGRGSVPRRPGRNPCW